MLEFVVHFVPDAPDGKYWVSGIEDGGRFWPSLHFRTKHPAQVDAHAMRDALCANPQIAAELYRRIRQRGA